MYTLQHKNQTVVIDAAGAFIDSYSISGKDVLFVRQVIDGKSRGGCHVCLPNFGPGGESDQPQHGYGRTVEWQVTGVSESDIKLEHTQLEGEYAGLHCQLTYSLSDDGLTMNLTCRNESSDSLRLTPGFHPYFACRAGKVVVDGRTYQAGALAGTEFYQAKSILWADFGDKLIKISSDILQTYALWTAHPDKYICVEPTLGGNIFSEREATPDELLAPNDIKSFKITINQIDR